VRVHLTTPNIKHTKHQTHQPVVRQTPQV
jgi:hypothetical protein